MCNLPYAQSYLSKVPGSVSRTARRRLEIDRFENRTHVLSPTYCRSHRRCRHVNSTQTQRCLWRQEIRSEKTVLVNKQSHAASLWHQDNIRIFVLSCLSR